jgi:hypothetical protein
MHENSYGKRCARVKNAKFIKKIWALRVFLEIIQRKKVSIEYMIISFNDKKMRFRSDE